MNSHRCWAEIDLAALRHNAEIARRCLGPEVAILAVIKANAYGHGLAQIARALAQQVQLFGVANLQEAIETRAAMPHPVMILGPALPEERSDIVAQRFIPSISNYDEALAFDRAASSSSVVNNPARSNSFNSSSEMFQSRCVLPTVCASNTITF